MIGEDQRKKMKKPKCYATKRVTITQNSDPSKPGYDITCSLCGLRDRCLVDYTVSRFTIRKVE